MRILHIVPVFPPSKFGGVKTSSYTIARYLVKRGHSVVVYTTDADMDKSRLSFSFKKLDGISVQYFKNLSNTLAFRYRLFTPVKMFSLIHKKNHISDLIHIHGFRDMLTVVAHHYAKKCSIPYIIQTHGSLPKIEKKRLKQVYDFLFGYGILKDSSKVIALNRFEAEQYKAMGVPDEKIAIIPNGIDLSEYANLPPKGSFKSKHNISQDKKVILYLGRIHRIKGIDLLIKTYAYLVKKISCKDTILVIAGPDDGYLNEAKALAKSLNIRDSVMFTGPLYGRDKLEAYMDSDVYVLPSRYEIFGMTVLEAYACSKPVIASNVEGLRDLVVNGETGLLFEAGNSEELAKNIHCLLNNYSKAEEMGLKGRKFVEENFTIDKVIEKLEHVYEDCLKRIVIT